MKGYSIDKVAPILTIIFVLSSLESLTTISDSIDPSLTIWSFGGNLVHFYSKGSWSSLRRGLFLTIILLAIGYSSPLSNSNSFIFSIVNLTVLKCTYLLAKTKQYSLSLPVAVKSTISLLKSFILNTIVSDCVSMILILPLFPAPNMN